MPLLSRRSYLTGRIVLGAILGVALTVMPATGTAQRRVRPDDDPRPGIYRTRDGEWRVDLPAAMEDALDRLSRDFEPWTDTDYRPSDIDGYDPSPRQTPWAVIGDFNDDGRLDVALAGRDDRDALVVFIVSSGKTKYRAIRAESEPYDPEDGMTIRPPVLSFLYPGRYVVDDRRLRHARTITVDQDAVQLTGGHRNGSVLYLVESNTVVPYYLTAPVDDEPAYRRRNRNDRGDDHDRRRDHDRRADQ